MNDLTERNRAWLEERFAVREEGYLAHQPIYGYGRGTSEGGHLRRFCRTLNIFRSVLPLSPASILDVGGAEGYSMSLARHLFGCEVVTTDLSHAACERAHEFWGLRAAALDAGRLPFADDSFDLVWCSEVIEHLARPFRTIAELHRVSKRFLMLTTDAALPWEVHRNASLMTRDPAEPHLDRNVWVPRDFEMLFGASCVVRPQYLVAATRLDDPTEERARALIPTLSAPTVPSRATQGVIVVVAKQGDTIPPPTTARDLGVLDCLFRGPIDACPRLADEWTTFRDRLRCPDCAEPLRCLDTVATCGACGRSVALDEPVLDLYPLRTTNDPRQRVPTNESELDVVRRWVSDARRRGYLLSLANRFESEHVARARLAYLGYRLVRGALNRMRG